MHTMWALAVVACHALSGASETTRPVDVTGDVLFYRVDPQAGGAITEFGHRSERRNAAGKGGLAQEGFGVGSYYAPGRRVNARAEIDDSIPERPVITAKYECEGPRIDGLAVERRVEGVPDSSTLKISWTIHNRGSEARWIAPWLRQMAAPGGQADDADRLDLPTPEGILSPKAIRFYPATRNWAAVTDTRERETVFTVFDAEMLHSWKALPNSDGAGMGYEAWFTPSFLAAGDTWSTTYILGLVRGLERVDFATERVIGNIEVSPDTLQVQMASVVAMETHRLQSVLIDEENATHSLPSRRFTLEPNRVLRTTYEDLSLDSKVFDYLARIDSPNDVVHLNPNTRAPHEGIDTRFSLDNKPAALSAWTDAPFRLNRAPQPWPGVSAKEGPLTVGVAESLHKIFEEDTPGPAGDIAIRLLSAKGEAESFQVLLRADEDAAPLPVTLRLRAPRMQGGKSKIAVDAITLHRVGHVPVVVPSHFENPTGRYPDPLTPLSGPLTLEPAQTLPLWLTVRVPPKTQAGIYRGAVEIHSANRALHVIPLEIEVLDFVLDTSEFQTDFNLDLDRLRADLDRAGYDGDAENALRDAMQDYGVRFRPLSGEAAALGFEEVARYPKTEERSAVVEALRKRPRNGPASLVVARGLEPFLPKDAKIWSVHLPVFDTAARGTLREAIDQGRRVWVHVDYEPSRPYANFFLENSVIEHRIVFWQAWALGAQGFQYWNAYAPPMDTDPRVSSLDHTPTNGNGVLIYPSDVGPLASIRLSSIRDGLEDVAYLNTLTRLLRVAREREIDPALLRRGEQALNLEKLVTDLTRFSHDPEVMREHRERIGRSIVELRKAVAKKE